MKPNRDGSDEDEVPGPAPSHLDERITGWTAVALLVVMWTGIYWAAPLAAAAPLAWVLHRGRAPLRTALVVRWVATVWIVGVVCIGLVGARAVRSVPFGPVGYGDARDWLDGAGGAPPGIWVMLAASAAVAIAAATTRGLLGCVALAGVVLWSAVIAGAVYVRCNNLFAATVVALPAWMLLWVAGMTMAIAPLSARGPSRQDSGGSAYPRRGLLIAGALVVAAVLVRLGAVAWYTELARKLTTR